MDTHSKRLPSLSQLGNTGASFASAEQETWPPKAGEKHDVPGDGSCLYHCLLKLRHLSGGWMHPDTPDPQDVDTLRVRTVASNPTKHTVSVHTCTRHMPVRVVACFVYLCVFNLSRQ